MKLFTKQSELIDLPSRYDVPISSQGFSYLYCEDRLGPSTYFFFYFTKQSELIDRPMG